MNEQNKKVPTVRFKGFTNDWEQRKLGEISRLYNGDRGNNYPKPSDIVSSGIPFINAGDLKNGQVDYKYSKHITLEKFNQLNGAKLQENDIIYCLRGTIGKNGYVYSNAKATIASSLICIRSISIKPYFLFQILNSDIELRQRKMVDEGAAQPNISAKNLKKFVINLPTTEEQMKISKVLKLLFTLITLQQKKLNLLKQLKKGLLQKMFADKGSKRPILRFEGFTGNWEIRQLKELGEIITGNTPKTSQVENYSSNGIPWVTPTDINSVYTTDSAKRLSTVGKDKAKIAPANSLLVTCIASIGKNTLILQESAFNQQINALIPVKNDPFFLLAESAKWSRIMRNLAGQTSMQIINKKTFSGISTSIPDLKEQKIIGSLFKKLDNTIAFQQQRISRVNEIKKSLLQQMFI